MSVPFVVCGGPSVVTIRFRVGSCLVPGGPWVIATRLRPWVRGCWAHFESCGVRARRAPTTVLPVWWVSASAAGEVGCLARHTPSTPGVQACSRAHAASALFMTPASSCLG